MRDLSQNTMIMSISNSVLDALTATPLMRRKQSAMLLTASAARSYSVISATNLLADKNIIRGLRVCAIMSQNIGMIFEVLSLTYSKGLESGDHP